MNKRLLSIALSIACGALALSGAAFAASSSPAETDSQSATTPATQPAPDQATARKDARKPDTRTVKDSGIKPGNRMCVQSTGSHLPPPKGKCLPVIGSSYSQKDLQRTGQPDISRALQMLDPSVTAGGH